MVIYRAGVFMQNEMNRFTRVPSVRLLAHPEDMWRMEEQPNPLGSISLRQLSGQQKVDRRSRRQCTTDSPLTQGMEGPAGRTRLTNIGLDSQLRPTQRMPPLA
jgi:hypothetical protein